MDGGLFYCCHSQTFPFLRIIYWILFSILFSKFSNIHNFEIFFLDFLYMVSPFKKNVTVPQETIHTRTVFKTIYKSGRRPCIEHHVIRQNLDFTTDLKVQHVPNYAINSWNLKNMIRRVWLMHSPGQYILKMLTWTEPCSIVLILKFSHSWE